jgi:hypothetical protein
MSPSTVNVTSDAHLVAVAALPVHDPELPVTLPVTLPINVAAVAFPVVENAPAVTVPVAFTVANEAVPVDVKLL